ncbi:MAG TPA: hypothetical protein VNT25_05025 [Allosphingosinicella sp.]|nr:hypothetical protein [Allosphingosinicella sp.]
MIIKGRALLAAAAALGLAFGAASPVAAQSDGARTPASWSYEIRNGQRVPKVERVTQADGSWSETMKQGNCTVTRTGRSGEVREVRKCD